MGGDFWFIVRFGSLGVKAKNIRYDHLNLHQLYLVANGGASGLLRPQLGL